MTKEWGMGFILSGIHVITGRRVPRRRKGEWQQTRQRYDKSPTFKFARLGLVCWVTVIYFAPWEEEKNGRVQCHWGVSCFPWLFFLGGHLPQTSGFRSAKQILVVSFATQATYFTPPGGREQRRGLMPLGLFWWSLAPDLRSVKTILAGNFRSFRVYSPEFSW